MTAVICNPQLELSSSCCSEQVVQVHQGGISTNLLGDKEQKNLHPEWNENPTEDYTELIMGCPSLVPKAILENRVEGTGILPEVIYHVYLEIVGVWDGHQGNRKIVGTGSFSAPEWVLERDPDAPVILLFPVLVSLGGKPGCLYGEGVKAHSSRSLGWDGWPQI